MSGPSFVRQRGNGDCAIAALATVTDLSYEDMAALIGWPCDPATGKTTKPRDRGLHFIELGAPLLEAGFFTTPILSHAVAAHLSGQPLRTVSSDEIKRIICGRRAVVSAPDPVAPKMPHAFAWLDDRLIDCRGDDVPETRIEDIELQGALVVARAE